MGFRLLIRHDLREGDAGLDTDMDELPTEAFRERGGSGSPVMR